MLKPSLIRPFRFSSFATHAAYQYRTCAALPNHECIRNRFSNLDSQGSVAGCPRFVGHTLPADYLCESAPVFSSECTLVRWTPLDSTGLDWTPLDWTGLHRTPLDWTGLHWTGLGSTGLDWTGLDTHFFYKLNVL